MSKTWKNNELAIAKAFGARRNPFSGSMSHQSQSDTLHEKFYIEIKDGKKALPTKLWADTVRKAKQEGKIPMVVKHGRQAKEQGVAVWMKQIGGIRPGGDLEDFPEDLRIREFPAEVLK